MQAIATLVHDDPFLKMPRSERMAAFRLRREKMWPAPIRPIAPVLLYVLPAPKPRPIVYRMWFEDLIEAADRELRSRAPRIEEIQAACASHYGVNRADLLAPGRTWDLVRPRQVAMYLAKILTALSLPEIGRRFGGRDHTTALHAIRKIGRLVQNDADLADVIIKIKADIAVRIA